MIERARYSPIPTPVSYTHLDVYKRQAERYDWLVKEFSDWAFTFTTSFLYYMDYDSLDEQTKNLYRQGMSCLLYTSRCV